jgi:hypothetical protein
MAKQPDVMLPNDAPEPAFEPYRPAAAPKGKRRRKDVQLPADGAPARSPTGVDASRLLNVAPEPAAAPAKPAAPAPPVAPFDVVSGKVGKRDGGKVDPTMIQRPRQRVATEEDPGAAQPASVADRIRARGGESARAGLALLSEADRKVAVKVRNKDYAPVKGYTDAMQGQAPVQRKGSFDPDRRARARAGLATLSGTPASSETSTPGAAPPVQVVIQQPGVPAAAASGRAPGELPQAPEDELPPVPLEEEPPPEPTVEELEADQQARDGIMQRQLDAEEDLATERVGVAEAEAEAMAEASTRYQDALSQAEAAKADQDARVQAQLEASDEANRLVQRTAKDAIAAAAIDTKRGWTTMGTARKVAFALSGIALGTAGNDDPMQYVRRYIDEDIEQQRQGAAKAEANVGTARAAAAEQDNLYQRTLATVGDERVTADVVRVARLEQIQADFKARLTKAGVNQLSAEQEVFLTKLEEDKAAAQMRLQSAAARNPEFFTKSVNVYGKGTREGMKLLGKEYIKGGASAGERADTQEGELEKIDLKGRAEAMTKQAELAAKRGNKTAEQAYAFGKDTERLQATMGMIDELTGPDDDGDIAGYGYTEGFNTPGKQDVDNQLRLITDELGRIKSGGAITEDELETFSNMIKGGVTLGDGSLFEGSEARLRKNLGQVRMFLKRKVDAMERGLSPEVRAYYNRNVASADYQARWSGGDAGDEGSVVEED